MSENHKSLFVPTEGIYLLNHSVGRPPKTTMDAFNKGFLSPWINAGEDTWGYWLQAIEDFRKALSRFLGSPADNFCPQSNLSSALTKIVSCLDSSAQRRTLLYSEQDFPSIAFVLQQASRQGFRLKALPAQVDTLDPTVWESYLTSDIAAVLVTHVHSNTSQQVPVASICTLAKEREILSIVDIAQSVGVVPIDLSQWQADFVIGSCVKWLCGGPGAGFLWGSSETLAGSEPTDVGWFSHEDPFEFDSNNFRYAKDALRFWGGTPSVTPYVVAANSIQLIDAIGIDTIHKHNLTLTQTIIDAVAPNDIVTPTDPAQRGGTVVLRLEESRQEAVCLRLRAANVAFDERPTGIRLSPHIYNLDEEIELVAGIL